VPWSRNLFAEFRSESGLRGATPREFVELSKRFNTETIY